jgi:DNA-binding MarR family transcriptional regulator
MARVDDLTSAADTSAASGYWYPEGNVGSVDVLNALRAYRTAEQAMRKRTRSSMGMGETDLSALRILLGAQRAGRTMSPKELAARLEISSASVTTMLDRLEKSGHLRRRRSETDGRAIIVEPTIGSDDEVRQTLGAMHTRMHDVADSLNPAEAAAVVGFLRRLADAVGVEDHHSESALHGS